MKSPWLTRCSAKTQCDLTLSISLVSGPVLFTSLVSLLDVLIFSVAVILFFQMVGYVSRLIFLYIQLHIIFRYL